MRTRPFQGHSHITEVECSGERLDSDTDLLTMVLYHVPDKRVLATANLKSRECSTSDQFSSCMINDRDSHSTRLRTLILDMAEHELRHFGCNLTTFRTDGTTDIISWSIYASQMRTCVPPSLISLLRLLWTLSAMFTYVCAVPHKPYGFCGR